MPSGVFPSRFLRCNCERNRHPRQVSKQSCSDPRNLGTHYRTPHDGPADGHISRRGRFVPSPGPAGGGGSAKNRCPRRQRLGPGTRGEQRGCSGGHHVPVQSREPLSLGPYPLGKEPEANPREGGGRTVTRFKPRERRWPRSGAALRAHGRGKGKGRPGQRSPD